MFKKRLFPVAALGMLFVFSSNSFAAVVFSYTSTPDDASMPMPSAQGWTEVGVWDAVYEGTAYSVVDPNPGYTAHGNVSMGWGNTSYIYQPLTTTQESDALTNGWTLNLQARFYQAWSAGFADTPEKEIGFGVQTTGGDVIVGHKLQRDTTAGTYATFLALFGGDGEDGIDKVETPRLNNAEGDPTLSPTYISYQLSYDPVSGEATLTATDSRAGIDTSYTISNTLAPSMGLWDGVGDTSLGDEPNDIPAGIFVGCPTAYGTIASGHVYIDSLTFEINDEPPYIAGDANSDGKVDGSDVTILAGNWQAGVPDGDPENVTWSMGDFNRDGKVDGSDVTILAGNWQYGVETAATSVPEPGTVILLLSAIGSLLVWRRFC